MGAQCHISASSEDVSHYAGDSVHCGVNCFLNRKVEGVKRMMYAKWKKSLGMQGMNHTMTIRSFRLKVTDSLFRSYWWIEYMGPGNPIESGDERTLDDAKTAAIDRFNLNFGEYEKIVSRETSGGG